MTSPAEDFEAAAPGVESAETVRQSAFLHQYRAELTGHRGTVRILTLAPERDDDAVEQAFRDVAGQWHNASSQPTIVTVHERGREPRPWIATELPTNQPLEAVQAELSLPETRTVLDETAEAIRNAYLYNSAHLALSPHSVCVDTTDDEPSVQVDEWGLKRACRVAAGETPVSPFTAPELLDDPDGGTEQTEVYGLGAVAYYALTGQLPITGGADLANAIQEGDITPPSEHRSEVPDDADRVVLTALSTRPTDRQDSAFAFKTAITEALPSEPPFEPAPEDETDAENETSTADETAESELGNSQDESVSPQAENNVSGESLSRRVMLGVLGLGGIGAIGTGTWYLTQPRSTSEAPPEIPTETDTTVPSITAFSLTNPSGLTLRTSFKSNEQLSSIQVNISGKESTTLTKNDFTLNSTSGGTYTYKSNYNYSSSGDYTATLIAATDSSGNNISNTRSADISVETSWPMHLYDEANTGSALNPGPLEGISKVWSFQKEMHSESSFAIRDQEIYFMGRNDGLFVLDMDGGSEIWTYEVENPGVCTPIVTDDQVVISGSGIISLDRNNGSVNWIKEGDYDILTYNGNSIYAPERSSLRSIEHDSGNIRWTFNPGSEIYMNGSPPAVKDGIVYVVARDDNNWILFAVNAESGSKRWEFKTQSKSLTYHAPVADTESVFINPGNTIYKLNNSTGEVEWKYAPSEVENPTATEPGGITLWKNLLITPTNWGFLALDKTDGSEVWYQDIGGENNPQPVVSNGYVYAATPPSYRTDDGLIIVLDAETGEEAGRYEADNPDQWGEITLPAVGNGCVFVGSQFGNQPKVVALEGENVSSVS
mgnify:CR=1 FL=1